MKAKLLLLSIVGSVLSIAAISEASAQRTITPFTKRVLDSTGKKVYVQPQAKKRSDIAVTFGYGYSSVTSLNSYANATFPVAYQGSGMKLDPSNVTSTIGSINIGLNYEITPWLELNVALLYSQSKGTQPYITPTNNVDKSGIYTDDWYSLLPSLRVNWMRNDWLSLYTRVGAGIGMGNRFETVNGAGHTSLTFAYQVSPLGIEMGRGNLNFFVEGGYGYTGFVTAGIKLKIGKVLKSGKTSTGRHVDWYDKYMD